VTALYPRAMSRSAAQPPMIAIVAIPPNDMKVNHPNRSATGHGVQEVSRHPGHAEVDEIHVAERPQAGSPITGVAEDGAHEIDSLTCVDVSVEASAVIHYKSTHGISHSKQPSPNRPNIHRHP
jgi:hypothetical protein